MKLAHTAIVTPHRAGLYETVRDLVSAERALGVDAVIIDPQSAPEDRGVPIGTAFDPKNFDVIINHSGLGKYEELAKDTPIIHCLHGRPESSFQLEVVGRVAVYTFVKTMSLRPNYKMWVTFWEDYMPYWELLLPVNKLRLITAPVDTKAWTPDGPSGYKFGGKGGEINVVCADMWREDKTPYHIIHCFCEFAKTNPGSKLHLYGVQRNSAINVLLGQVEERGWLGEVTGYVTGLDNVYRAATMAISTHRIATRSIREALACGCPVVHANGSAKGTDHADPEHTFRFAKVMSNVLINNKDNRREARDSALINYDSSKTASEMIALATEVLSG